MKDEIISLIEKRKYKSLYDLLEVMNEVDLSLLMAELNNEDMLKVFRLLPKDKAVDVFSYLDSDDQQRLIASLTDNELEKVIGDMYLDDTVDLVSEMPANIVRRILKTTDPHQRKLINEILQYPEDSAGSLMTIEFVDLRSSMTVDAAIEKIRRDAIDKETIYTCYVLDETRHLTGIVTVKDLLVAKGDTLLSDIMETNIISANTLEDKEDVAKMFDKYDFLALPVVDSENRLVGIITVDDAMDVLQEENAEDFEIMAAVNPSDDTYFKTSVFKHAKNRIVWLTVLMFSSMLSGAIINHFDAVFAAYPILVSFMTMISGTGGNSGSQSSTLIIRGMATDEIQLKDYFKVVWKEFRVAAICAVALAAMNGLRVFIQYQDFSLSLVIFFTLICTVIFSKLLGCSLPMLAKLVHVDPAIMATPFISTIVDACSMLLYFTIAMRILHIPS